MDRQPPRRPVTVTSPRPAPPRPTAADPRAPVVRRPRRAAAAVLGAALLGGAALAGCSSDANPGSAVSSAAAQAGSGIAGAASAAASAASSALASAAGGVSSALASVASSAQAAASSAIADVKGGLDAKGDVTAGAVSIADGKAEVTLTVTNHEQESNQYVVQVNFTDDSGNVLDATAVKVPDLAAGQSTEVKARSNRDLTGSVKAVIANAVRY
ncbi:FxLYD domain-containing protein [Kitasatospora sp. NPDC056327]|uniref:FxLYD domain-containing protein n=1 Tax=Kitasatospora sp. NPDC056327 TaxID=3345785 RepID=UPI0035E24C2E